MLEDEKKLVEQAKQGDASSFGDLYDHYVQPIYRFILLKVSSGEEAQDLTHDVFMKAWRTLPNFQERGFPFSSWLYKIARNRVIDHYRTKKPNTSLEDFLQVESEEFLEGARFETEFDIKIAVTEVKKAMKSLTEEQQDVILMKYVEELEIYEIAKILDKKEGAVRVIQHRALEKLKKKFGKTNEK